MAAGRPSRSNGSRKRRSSGRGRARGAAVVPAGAKVIDGSGKFLIPGLWDMHAHLADESYRGWFLRYGVTGVRHMFALNPLYPQTKPTDPATGLVVPRVVIANQILDGPDTFSSGR